MQQPISAMSKGEQSISALRRVGGQERREFLRRPGDEREFTSDFKAGSGQSNLNSRTATAEF